jgi:hypothetical protein
MFFHIDSISEFKTSLQSWTFATISLIVTKGSGGEDNKCEKKLMFTTWGGAGGGGGRGEGGELDKMFLLGGAFLEIFLINLKDSYNGNQCTLILIRM